MKLKFNLNVYIFFGPATTNHCYIPAVSTDKNRIYKNYLCYIDDQLKQQYEYNSPRVDPENNTWELYPELKKL
jgi:hypothetical protein